MALNRISEALTGLTGWIATGIASGTTIVTTAAVIDPNGTDLAMLANKTPPLVASVLMLLMSVLTYILRKDNQQVTKSTASDLAIGAQKQNQTLLDRIESLAFEHRSSAREVGKETNEFRQDISSTLGGMSATLNIIQRRNEEITDKVDVLGNRLTVVETLARQDRREAHK